MSELLSANPSNRDQSSITNQASAASRMQNTSKILLSQEERIFEETKKAISEYVGNVERLRNIAKKLADDNLDLLVKNNLLQTSIATKEEELKKMRQEGTAELQQYQQCKVSLAQQLEQFTTSRVQSDAEYSQLMLKYTNQLQDLQATLQKRNQEIVSVVDELEAKRQEFEQNKQTQKENLQSARIVQSELMKSQMKN
jgi:hypothetical protein